MTQAKDFEPVRRILKRMIRQGYLLSDTSHLWFGQIQSSKTLVKNKLTEVIMGNKRPKRSESNAIRRGDRVYVMSDGYICQFLPDHPNSNIKGLYAEHRNVMEQEIGRLLTKKEVVHHINGNVSDNSIENLMLFANDNEHKGFHKEQRSILAKTSINLANA